MKKLLSLVMSLVMLMSIAAGAEFSAKAESYDEIKVGQTKSVTVTSPGDRDEMICFMFFAEKAGTYYFYSTGNLDTFGVATKSTSAENVIMEDDNYINGNFVIEMYLNKREVAAFTANAYTPGSFNVTLSDKAPSNYTPCKHSNTTVFEQVKATCTSDGFTGQKVCKDCSKIMDFGQTVPKASSIKRSKNEFVYNGKVQRPSITVTDRNGKKLEYKKDFTVDYSNWNSTNAGTYKVTVNLIGKYKDTRTYTYKIVPQSKTTAKMSRNTFTTNGKVQRPTVTVTDSNGKQLTYKKDFTVDYSNWNSTNVGRYTVTVKMKGNYSGTKTFAYYINPKPTEFVPSNKGGFKAIKNGFTLKWNKQASQTTGYQIQYATKRDFSTAATVTVANPNTTSKTIKGRAGNTRYYVRIRTYKKIGNGTFYSNWNSGTKSVVTLK